MSHFLGIFGCPVLVLFDLQLVKNKSMEGCFDLKKQVSRATHRHHSVSLVL